jgi:hypothetical protein
MRITESPFIDELADGRNAELNTDLLANLRSFPVSWYRPFTAVIDLKDKHVAELAITGS